MKIHFWLSLLASIIFLICWIITWRNITHPDSGTGGLSTGVIALCTAYLVFGLGLYVVTIVVIWSHALLMKNREKLE